ncbi:septum formation initiator [Winogradskya humida]|uniref:Septum formation initiator n=1 Tax=Winogradskya humida TaxID=113566 RepID=A0ABQ3ZMC3_9ACTN|nr:septum formation initiator [Actinoplanes humidus]
MPLPLVITEDPDLLDDLLRLAAAGGTEVELAADPAAARARYLSAPLILIGSDQAEDCLRAGLPRRYGVLVVGLNPIDDDVWDLAESLGAEHLALLPEAEPWVVDRITAAIQPPAAGRAIAVIGGRGGAGASTLAGGLAVTAVRRGLRTLLLDADPLGGGLDLVLGWERLSGLRWPALAEAGGHIDPPALLGALPQRGDLVLLSFARDGLTAVPSDVMAGALAAAHTRRDVTVMDLPRHLDDAATLALQAADQAVLVVPAELRAAAAAARVAAVARLHCPDLSVVVRGPAPGRLKPREVARSLGLPLAGALRPEESLRNGLERGDAPTQDGRGPLAELCGRLIARLLVAKSEAVA